MPTPPNHQVPPDRDWYSWASHTPTGGSSMDHTTTLSPTNREGKRREDHPAEMQANTAVVAGDDEYSVGDSTNDYSYPTTDTSFVVVQPERRRSRQSYSCPRGHTLERILSGAGGKKCDICKRSLVAGEEIWVCPPCHGFSVCQNNTASETTTCCTEKSHLPHPVTTILEHQVVGKKLFEEDNCIKAEEEFQKGLDICQNSLMANNEDYSREYASLGASCALMLAKTQHLLVLQANNNNQNGGDNADKAIKSCQTAISYYEFSGEKYHQHQQMAHQLLKDIIGQEKEIQYTKTTDADELSIFAKSTENSHIGMQNKSDQPSIYAKSTENFDTGMELFDSGEFEGAVAEFQKSLVLRQSLQKESSLESHQSARSAEMLAKAQHLSGDIETAIQTCQAATSLYKESGENWEEEMILSKQLEQDMTNIRNEVKEAQQQQQEESLPREISLSIAGGDKNSANTTTTAPDDSDSDLLGVSLHHLKTNFMARIRVANLDEDSNIHSIENLQGPPGVIRRRSAKFTCPIDGKMGCAYVHTLVGKDNVGVATHMLSYSWSYSIGDILDALGDYCEVHNLDPKRTYIWIDCICINQHRVVEQKEEGGTGLLNFQKEFPKKLMKIGNMLAMMTPWYDPVYLTRIWCIFELYSAHTTSECTVDIVMPKSQKYALAMDVISKEKRINKLYKELGNIKVQNAKATLDQDRKAILGMIESTVGYRVLNKQVNNLLRGWMKRALLQLVETKEEDETNEWGIDSVVEGMGTLLSSMRNAMARWK